MQATIHPRVPHVRDSLIVANVGGVTYADRVPKVNEAAAIPLWEPR